MAKSAATTSKNKKAGAKGEKPKAAAAKKPEAKKAEVKKAAPKKTEAKKAAPAKPAAKKEVAKKVATKKETAKPAAKATKPAPKKAEAKPAAKKATPKPAAKAVKAAPKKIEKTAAKTTEKASPKKAEKVIKHATTERIEEMSPMSKKERVPLAPGRSHKVTVENESLAIASPTQHIVADDISDSIASQVQHLAEPTVSDPKQPDPVRHDRETPSYGDADLKEFQKIIDSAKEEAMDELRMLRERLDDLNNSDFAEESAVYSMHMAEQGNEAQEKEKTYAQIQRINDYVRKLDEATARIHDKTYGVCRECNILIAKQRLLAVPITTLSASWKIRQQCPPDGIDRVGKQQ